MKHQATRQLFDYWNLLRRERTAPERSEIDPTAIRDVLADSFMLDVDLDRRFPFRLAGTRVNGLLGAEQKGASFLDLWRGEEQRNISAILLTVADGACPVVAGGVVVPDGMAEAAFELLVLPLRHHGKTHARILGLVRLMANPAWLGLLSVGPMSLRSLRVVDARECEALRPIEQIAVGQVGSGPAISPGPWAGGVASQKPRLRVIQGGL